MSSVSPISDANMAYTTKPSLEVHSETPIILGIINHYISNIKKLEGYEHILECMGSSSALVFIYKSSFDPTTDTLHDKLPQWIVSTII